MFKLFRQYNKYILVFGVSALMIVFLIEGALMQSQNRPGDETVGTLNGKTVTAADLQHAQGQVAILNAINGALPVLASPDPMAWFLMREEAAAMKISASEVEVDSLLKSVGLDDDKKLMERMKQYNAALPTIRETVRHWLAVQTYRELILGRGHSPVEMKLQGIQFANMLRTGPYREIGEEMTRGIPRVSEGVLAHLLQDEAAVLKMTAIRVSAERYASKTAPDESLVKELYSKYKDVLPRQAPSAANPHALGYRLPDLAQLEYLSIPSARLEGAIVIDEADLLTYYDQHKSEFIPQPKDDSAATTRPALPPQPYEEVRDRIESRMRSQRAQELGDKVAAAAIAQLSAPLKDLPENAGYKKIPAGFKAPALSAVAESLQKQFGVLPDVMRIEDRWLDREALAALPGIGDIQLGRGMTTADYVFSANEFWAGEPKADAKAAAAPATELRDALRRLRLQVGVPSVTLPDMLQNRYIFRVTAAQPSRPPKDLDEVRARVAADASAILAYRALKADAPNLLKRLIAEPPNDLAKALGTVRLSPEFPRRQTDRMTGELGVPEVPGIGKDEAFVDGVFALVDKAGGPAINTLPVDKRVGTVELDNQFSLVLIRLEEYKPLTRSQFEAQSRGGFLPLPIRASAQLFPASAQADPFSVDAISKRVKFVPRHAKEKEEDKTPAKTPDGAGEKPAPAEKG